MKQKNESGSAAAVTIVVLVIAVLTLVGYTFWQNYIASKDSAGDTMQTSVAKKETSQTKPDTTKYLAISDWGIKFKLAETDTEIIQYKVVDEFGAHYELTTRRVEALGGNCSRADGQGPAGTLAAISRTSVRDDEQMGAAAINNNEPIKGYYYYMVGSQSTCSETATDVQSNDRAIILKMLQDPLTD